MNPRKHLDVNEPSLLGQAIPFLQFLRNFFGRRSVTTYLVGGFLRDVLLGRSTGDIDLAVQGDTLLWAKELAHETGGTFVLLDEDRAIARVVLHPRKSSLQMWQEMGIKTRGIQNIQIDLTSFSGEITKDLARRDFTIDALALSLDDVLGESPGNDMCVGVKNNNHLHDPFGGLSDLADATVRAVSHNAFQDDPVRLMRGVRLVAQLGFSLDEDTHEVIKRDSHLLSTVAPERLRDELLKTLAERNASHHLRLMDDLGLLCRLIPELEDARGVEQPKEHYWDVFYHCLETPGQVERLTTEKNRAGDEDISHSPWHPLLDAHFDEEISDGHTRRTLIKLAGLLHDVAKPATKSFEPTGRMRFLGHDIQGAEICQEILHRLRLSSRGINLISTMVRHHLRPTQMNQGVDLPTPRATYRYFRDLGEASIDTLYLNMADYLAAKGPSIEIEDWQGHCRLIDHILRRGLDQDGAVQKAPGLVDGHLLMETLGLSPGAQVGRLLEAIQEAHGAGEIATREEAIQLAHRLVSASCP